MVRRTCGPNLLVQGGLVLLQPLLALFDGAAILAILLGRIIQLGGVSLEAWKLVRGGGVPQGAGCKL